MPIRTGASTSSGSIRVVLIDDSPLALRLLSRGLARFGDISVVGTAEDGDAALELIERTNPDVICTDLHMPGLDGLGLVRRVMSTRPKPMIVVSSAVGSSSAEGRDNVFELMRAGALDVSDKPRGGIDDRMSDEFLALARKIRIAAGVTVFRRSPGAATPVRANPPPDATRTTAPAGFSPPGSQAIEIVVIGASTGGPTALLEVISGLPRSLPVPVVVVQHIAAGFLPGMARWLTLSSGFPVEIACNGAVPRAGVCYLAPSGRHLVLNRTKRFELIDGPSPESGHQPSVDVLFESAAACFGPHVMAVLLTGMGRDGARGMGAVFRAKGSTIAQDESSCVIFGMPAAAISSGYAQSVLPLKAIAAEIARAAAAPNANEPTARHGG